MRWRHTQSPLLPLLIVVASLIARTNELNAPSLTCRCRPFEVLEQKCPVEEKKEKKQQQRDDPEVVSEGIESITQDSLHLPSATPTVQIYQENWTTGEEKDLEVSEDEGLKSNAEPIPDFPSFEEWKRDHAARAATISSSPKDNSQKRMSMPEGRALDGNTSSRDMAMNDKKGYAANPSRNYSKSLDHDPTALGEVAESDVTTHSEDTNDPSAEKKVALPVSKRILPALPHSGSGDPLLDPLISLGDRTNYASFDCSATLIRSSKNTKSASAILSSKKDRYMLTPCSSKEKFVIIELCDEIQIETIVLANLEFFSSMFKIFTVKAGTAYPESAGTWHELGTYRASNVRGMQVFRPFEPSSSGFYRYLRIDFISHYGTEYYCPVSLLKAYGLTQLDAYRRDQRVETRLAEMEPSDLVEQVVSVESIRAKDLDESYVQEQLMEASEDTSDSINEKETFAFSETNPALADINAIKVEITPLWITATAAHFSNAIAHGMVSETSVPLGVTRTTSLESLTQAISELYAETTPSTTSSALDSLMLSARASVIKDNPEAELASAAVLTATKDTLIPHRSSGRGSSDSSSATFLTGSIRLQQKEDPSRVSGSEADNISPASAPTQPQLHSSFEARETASVFSGTPGVSASSSSKGATSTITPVAVRDRANAFKSTVLSSRNILTAQPQGSSQQKRNDTRTPQTAQQQVVYTHSHVNQPQPNESIYGTIMKRLLSLEVNATLSTAYFEEHTKFVWSTFRRIEDRLGNMERSRNKQDQLLKRVISNIDLHRTKMEAERTELSTQISMLNREMVLEKRLNLAQLFALVILLFFVILTRGSPSTPFFSLPDTRAGPASVFSNRPWRQRRQSLKDRPEHATLSINTLRDFPNKDRRSHEADRRNVVMSSNGMMRNSSSKRGTRVSGNLRSRPAPYGAPLRSTSGSGILTGQTPALSAMSGPLPTGTHTSFALLRSTHRNPPPSPMDVFVDASQQTPTFSTAQTDRTSSPLEKTRSARPIRREFRQLRLKRSASLDENLLSPTSSHFGVLEPSIVARMTSENSLSQPTESPHTYDQESNAELWQSDLEDSADEAAKKEISRASNASPLISAYTMFPPSPDPSDAEQQKALSSV